MLTVPNDNVNNNNYNLSQYSPPMQIINSVQPQMQFLPQLIQPQIQFLPQIQLQPQSIYLLNSNYYNNPIANTNINNMTAMNRNIINANVNTNNIHNSPWILPIANNTAVTGNNSYYISPFPIQLQSNSNSN